VIGGFLDNVKKSPNLFQHGYLQLENFFWEIENSPNLPPQACQTE